MMGMEEDHVWAPPSTVPGNGAPGKGGGVEVVDDTCLEIQIDFSNEDDIKIACDGDTTSEQASRGKDIQGISWERLHFTRETYRETRLQHYKNYLNFDSNSTIPGDTFHVDRGREYFSFFHNTRAVRCSIIHFQLRNLVWATSPHDLYIMHDNVIKHWNTITRERSTILNLAGGSGADGRVSVSTMCASNGIVAAGGFNGELIVKKICDRDLTFSGRITTDENAITNAIEIVSDRGSEGEGQQILTSNNDSIVRLFDVERLGSTNALTNRFKFDWAVNYATMCPDHNLICVVGDHTDGLLADPRSGRTVMHLKGHLDFSFAAAWHPGGRLVATGNQDTTTRLWDIRYLGTTFVTLQGKIGAVRGLRYDPSGRFLAVAEPADFVHVYDGHMNYQEAQEIDLFGEVAGISFCPEGSSLFVGIADLTYGSLIEFDLNKQ